MKKNCFGITVRTWDENQVVGLDHNGVPFKAVSKRDGRGNTYFELHDEEWYEKHFFTTPPVPLPIVKMMDLSTAHITKETDAYLQEQALADVGPESIVYAKGRWGYIVHIGEDTASLPDDLASLIKLCQSEGCSWLVLDADGPIVDDLPTWDWEEGNK